MIIGKIRWSLYPNLKREKKAQLRSNWIQRPIMIIYQRNCVMKNYFRYLKLIDKFKLTHIGSNTVRWFTNRTRRICGGLLLTPHSAMH